MGVDDFCTPAKMLDLASYSCPHWTRGITHEKDFPLRVSMLIALYMMQERDMPAKEVFGGYISSSEHHSLQPTVGCSYSADRLDGEVDIHYSTGQ